jgi:hypothetical protein
MMWDAKKHNLSKKYSPGPIENRDRELLNKEKGLICDAIHKMELSEWLEDISEIRDVKLQIGPENVWPSKSKLTQNLNNILIAWVSKEIFVVDFFK